MTLLRLLLFAMLGLLMGLITLTVVACQAVVLGAVLALSRFARLFGGRAAPTAGPADPSASIRGRVIEGEFSVDSSAGGGRGDN